MRRLRSLEAERWLFWQLSTLYGSTLLELWRFQRCEQERQIIYLGKLRYKTSWKRCGMPIWTGLQATWTCSGVLGGVCQGPWGRLGAFLGRLGGVFGGLRVVWDTSWRFVLIFQANWQCLGGILEASWSFLGLVFGVSKTSWKRYHIDCPFWRSATPA